MSEEARKHFERFIAAAPYEKSVERHPESSAWPGNYMDMAVSLAWHSFCEGYQLRQDNEECEMCAM